MNALDWTTKILVIVGALNWGLFAIDSAYNLVELLSYSWLITTVYTLVALSGVWELVKLFKE
jgi:uncharacterized membrane protein YuzA (DUF378 family)